MIFSTPFTTRPPQRFDWAGGVRGFVAVMLAIATVAVEIVALLLVPGGSWFAGFLVFLSVFLLVPGTAFAASFGGAWRGPARTWGIFAGVAIILPPFAVLVSLIPFSIFYVGFVLIVAFAGRVIGKRRPPARRFD
ncbi:hypothetical protein [Herbiconiux sp. L3-i23]|uniref:hypothetical protein n=1 Tax=Herbiconiux sp. L3-i23 TaxID=2905871 RepID=UPI00204E7EBF|nr:hypothetical protein [Herbiconiux sp. L3-i23]BDI21898.1 hypothetical protein L3i23_06740 [Herbiconiux sp. L3-i23]